jgi:hypothetical protein
VTGVQTCALPISHVEAIHVFVEDAALDTCEWEEAKDLRRAWLDPKATLVRPLKRQTFADLIGYANGLRNGLVMLSNADIYYDGTLALLSKVDFLKHVVCLSKTEVTDGQHRSWSQDSWIWKPPIKVIGDYYMGLMRCDNRLAFELREIGLIPINPCDSIHSHHLHASEIRTYCKTQDVVPGPVFWIPPPYSIP